MALSRIQHRKKTGLLSSGVDGRVEDLMGVDIQYAINHRTEARVVFSIHYRFRRLEEESFLHYGNNPGARQAAPVLPSA
jgi:hypothetical protein